MKGTTYVRAFQYYTKAAKLGDFEAHQNLSIMYHKGEGVEKDMKKAVYHMEEAAIGGHHEARYNLGAHEVEKNRRIKKGMKHFMIAANLGCDKSLEVVKNGFVKGVVSKQDYASSLRGHQAAVDATKSAQREEAYTFYSQRLPKK